MQNGCKFGDKTSPEATTAFGSWNEARDQTNLVRQARRGGGRFQTTGTSFTAGTRSLIDSSLRLRMPFIVMAMVPMVVHCWHEGHLSGHPGAPPLNGQSRGANSDSDASEPVAIQTNANAGCTWPHFDKALSQQTLFRLLVKCCH